jgi:hypothetical protein
MWEWSPESPFLKYLSVLFWTWESNTKQGSKLWPSRSEEKPGICSWWFSFQLHKLATRKSVIYTDFQASEERYIDHVGVRTRCWSLSIKANCFWPCIKNFGMTPKCTLRLQAETFLMCWSYMWSKRMHQENALWSKALNFGSLGWCLWNW